MGFEDNWGICDKCGKETKLEAYGGEYWCSSCIGIDQANQKSAHHQKDVEKAKKLIGGFRGE